MEWAAVAAGNYLWPGLRFHVAQRSPNAAHAPELIICTHTSQQILLGRTAAATMRRYADARPELS